MGVMDLMDEKHRSDLFQAQAHVHRHIYSFINSMSLNCVVDLGIPDVIHKHGRPMTLSQLVAALPIRPSRAEGVYRLMRLMVQSGFFSLRKLSENEEEEGYVLTNASQLLLKDHPLSMLPCFDGMEDQMLMQAFHNLSRWFRNGEDVTTPFETAHGATFWDYLVSDPRRSGIFNKAMAVDARLAITVLIDEGRKGLFDGLKSIVDVGGGAGGAARAVAEAFPELECTVLDLPHVVAGARETGNLKFLGGDMFRYVPPADGLLLKCVLHDWSDEECVKILERCKEAIKGREGGKVMVVEMVLGDRDEVSVQTQLSNDMALMMLTTGKERTEKEWSKIFKDASFSHYKITPTLDLKSIIELFP